MCSFVERSAGARRLFPCMARTPRAVVVDTPHHVTQRGNGRRMVFFTDRDREVYLDAFFDYAARYSLRVWGYCLMSNHVHFVVVPERERSMARVFGRTHSDYARYANLARRSCGHFWQSQFYSCALDGQHAWEPLAYVERNPVRSGPLPGGRAGRTSRFGAMGTAVHGRILAGGVGRRAAECRHGRADSGSHAARLPPGRRRVCGPHQPGARPGCAPPPARPSAETG